MIRIIVIRVWGDAGQVVFEIPEKAVIISYEPFVVGHIHDPGIQFNTPSLSMSCLTYYMTETDYKNPL